MTGTQVKVPLKDYRQNWWQGSAPGERLKLLGFYNFSLRQDEDGIVKDNGVVERPKDLHRKITHLTITRGGTTLTSPRQTLSFFLFLLWNHELTDTLDQITEFYPVFLSKLVKERLKFYCCVVIVVLDRVLF